MTSLTVDPSASQVDTPPVTTRTCIESAARLLRQAEVETDRTLMQAYDWIAASWINLGRLALDEQHDTV